MVSVNTAMQASGSSTPAGQQPNKTTLDYQSFLKLFIEQLKHQDPTEPLDASESLAQLATFSQVEQSVSTNNKLDALLATQYVSQANSFIGRTVTTYDGGISGKVASVSIMSDGLIAELETGEKVLLDAGIKVS